MVVSKVVAFDSTEVRTTHHCHSVVKWSNGQMGKWANGQMGRWVVGPQELVHPLCLGSWTPETDWASGGVIRRPVEINDSMLRITGYVCTCMYIRIRSLERIVVARRLEGGMTWRD